MNLNAEEVVAIIKKERDAWAGSPATAHNRPLWADMVVRACDSILAKVESAHQAKLQEVIGELVKNASPPDGDCTT